MKESNKEIWLVYDGECPLCSASARALKIRKAVGVLHIINAREQHPILDEINHAGLNLDEGMVVKLNDKLYHGVAAQHLLAMIGTNNNFFNRLNVILFRSKFIAKLIYPILKMMRNILLRIKRVPKLHNLHSIDHHEPIFKKVFGEHWKNLPICMQKHYFIRPFTEDKIFIKGKMDIDYSGFFSILMPMFKLFHVLVPFKGKDITLDVNLHSVPNTSAFYFDRTFNFPDKKPYIFRSYMQHIKDNVVVEFMKFGIGWRMLYSYENNKVLLKHHGYIWKIFGVLIPLPLHLILGKVNVEKESISEDDFRLRMEIIHPFGGKYFYTGQFKIVSTKI